MPKHTVLGILAHVDAGKTTLSENILYRTGVIREEGRVDRGNTHLDTDQMERERGITIFSRQAVFPLGERSVTLLDTPGHVDFTPEMERALQVLDAAVLLISAREGVNGHVRTIWRLLAHYQIPTFLFVNKMDQLDSDPQAERERILEGLRRELGEGAVCLEAAFCSDSAKEGGAAKAQNQEELNERRFPLSTELQEEIAVLNEGLMEKVLSGESITDGDLHRLIEERKLFPVFFGSALRDQGVGELLDGLAWLLPEHSTGADDAFAARVYKITREGGQRLSWMKIEGGSLKVREEISTPAGKEKVTELRVYSGDKFTAVQEAVPGMLIAVCGLTGTAVGDTLGAARRIETQKLQPILSCALELPAGTDVHHAYQELRRLEEEEPMLHLAYDEKRREIAAEVYGEVQIEILTRMIRERYDLGVRFGPGRIVYQETIREAAEGVGHFEPLRHYAEVHLRLEPLSPGSGLQFDSECPVNVLARNWQRLVLTHLQERKFYGVLTGSVITDMRIVLTGGRAHEKHTEGGDFRQATYRAVRQGLMMAENILLEPIYDFELTLPQRNLGRALTDLQTMGAKVQAPELSGETALVRGTVPAEAIVRGTAADAAGAEGYSGGYAAEVRAYTRGEGSLTTSLHGYAPCHNAEEIIRKTGYDPESDLRNLSSSVFCSHGVGTIIPWDQVRDYMHVDTGFRFPWEKRDARTDTAGIAADGMSAEEEERVMAQAYRGDISGRSDSAPQSYEERQRAFFAEEAELRRIFERTYGPVKEKRVSREQPREIRAGDESGANRPAKGKPVQDSYLLVDGYNIIFAWEELRSLALQDIKAARDRLQDILSNYAGYRDDKVILVFDAYRVPGGKGSVERYHNIDVVYTKQAETADLYIEQTAHRLVKHSRVTVATSDAIEQVIIYGAGAIRMSANGLRESVQAAEREMREKYDL